MVYLNPIYGVRNERTSSFVYVADHSYETILKKLPSCVEIPPLYGYILSEFQKPCEKEDKIFEISNKIGVKTESIKTFVDQLIDNNKYLNFKVSEKDFVLPPNLLIKGEETDKLAIISNDTDIDPFYRFTPTRPSIPLGVTVMMTSKCKTDCIYCYADRSIKLDFPVKKLLDIIEDCHQSGVLSLNLSGGDIFTYKHWRPVIEKMSECRYTSFLSTKIPLSKEDIQFLYKCGIREIQFSLDSTNPEDLKELVRMESSYIENIRAMFESCNMYNLKLNIRTVLTKHNAKVEILKNLYNELCKYHVNSWTVVPAFLSYYKKDKEDYRATSDRLKECKDFIESIKQESDFRITFYNNKTPKNIHYETVNDFLLYNKSCVTTSYNISINIDGNVTVCEMLYNRTKFHLGNIHYSTIKELWNSDLIKDFFNFNLKTLSPNTDSPCYKCSDFGRCKIGNSKKVCLVDIVNCYGEDKWDYPDPHCPQAPEGNFDLLLN